MFGKPFFFLRLTRSYAEREALFAQQRVAPVATSVRYDLFAAWQVSHEHPFRIARPMRPCIMI